MAVTEKQGWLLHVGRAGKAPEQVTMELEMRGHENSTGTAAAQSERQARCDRRELGLCRC